MISKVKENSKILLAEKGITDWNIVVCREASDAEKYAAEELQYFLKEISGVVFPILDDSREEMVHEILVGNSRRINKLNLDIQIDKLGADGFVVCTEKGKLVITGGRPRGTLYGVYAFLEEYLGCRWFAPKVSSIPKRSVIEIPAIHDRQVPALKYREDFYYDAFEGDWSARNRVLGQFHHLNAKHGGTLKYHNPFVHSFDTLVPVAEYFETHPEYFSEIDGVRIKERTQLCLTNSDVLRIATERVMQWIQDDQDTNIFSISQNDCYNPCQCEKCRVIDDREESQSGTLLNFVNQIAEVVGKKYAGKKIDTLAYQYSALLLITKDK
jgi:hypothetical protein